MNRIQLCFQIEDSEYAELPAQPARPDLTPEGWANLYREFRTQVYPRLVNGPRWMMYVDMKPYLMMGMVYREDGDRTSRELYGLTDRAYAVRGVKQFETAVKDYYAQQERIRAEMAAAEQRNTPAVEDTDAECIAEVAEAAWNFYHERQQAWAKMCDDRRAEMEETR